ncbi:MAG TPA: sigma-70 family RNA polymerase sigma factor [Gemmataceae bacterium]|jgi:RNA polymerase sigma-70 factor (ECF subfamily)|nr:sigma-70 family RNA polymerase sigma factor [Gemmataceae bacterium]
MPDTSISLLERLRLQPDEGSWKRLVDLYVPLIRGWLRRYDVSPEDAEDLAQDVMALVVREIPDFQHNQQPGAFRKWLRTITVNRLRMLWRARQGKAAASGNSDVLQMLDQLEDPNSGLSRVWDEQHNQHVARRLMEMIQPQFAPATWKAFRRVVLDGQKPAVVAAEFGISVNAVLLAKSRVLRRLRQEMRGLTD